MIYTFLIAAIGIIGIMAVWILIQTLWRRTFTEYISDDDVMAGRSSCRNCSCTTTCKLSPSSETASNTILQHQSQ